MPISSMARQYVSTLSVVLLMICSVLSKSGFAADADYRLGSGDLLRVNVFGSPELSGEVRVSESGNITYPLIGQVPVAGKSPTQVEAQLVGHQRHGAAGGSGQLGLAQERVASGQISHGSAPGRRLRGSAVAG